LPICWNCRERGFDDLALTEHSRRVTAAHGLKADRLLAQIDEIDRLNAEGLGITVLKGIKVDILEDGRLDLPDAGLGRLDLVVGAVHSRFNLSRDKQTERILRAMDHPHVTLLAHPTGRLIQARESDDVDIADHPGRARAWLFPRTECSSRTARPARYPLPEGHGGRGAGQHQFRRLSHD
jgi:DNA polymerase (family 10)